MEKYLINKKDLHLAFIDLEEAFDRVPRKLVWESLRVQKVLECYIDISKAIYNGVNTRVRSLAQTKRLRSTWVSTKVPLQIHH